MTKIKICGLTRAEDIDAVNRYLPDYIGFVLAPSRRRITPETAGRLKRGLDPRIRAVGVFVNQDIQMIIDLCQAGILDAVQLHGDESNSYLELLKQSITCPVIKAIRIKNPGQVMEPIDRTTADLILFDTYNEHRYGGSGRLFDWDLIPASTRPFFLAGGLTKDNLAHAIEMVKPFGVDISSGAETEGRKDEDKIRQIMEIIRTMDYKDINERSEQA
ncbi:MAG: phosphoribosylanthranilate isomerase [Syntrophomonas sp.]|nr:phosphoribosylanthranilate isomerase [Syntrophomonas sp.]